MDIFKDFMEKMADEVINSLIHDFGDEAWEGRIMPMGIMINTKDKVYNMKDRRDIKGAINIISCNGAVYIYDNRNKEGNPLYYCVPPMIIWTEINKFT